MSIGKAAAVTAQLVMLASAAAGAAAAQDGSPEWKIIHAGHALLVCNRSYSS